tara:strand:- start:134 stop:391 length:258 start_codon:yes stop_codon:yes gene_type:complete
MRNHPKTNSNEQPARVGDLVSVTRIHTKGGTVGINGTIINVIDADPERAPLTVTVLMHHSGKRQTFFHRFVHVVQRAEEQEQEEG